MEKLLFLQQAGVAGDTLPLGISQDPSIGEASSVLVGLALVGAFGVINTRDHGRILVKDHLHILDIQGVDFEARVRDVGEKFSSLADFAVPLGVYELVADHACQRVRIAVHLRLVPEMLKSNKLIFTRARIIACRLGKHAHGQHKAADDKETGDDFAPLKHEGILSQSSRRRNAHRFDAAYAPSYVTDVIGSDSGSSQNPGR
jgi:hypothetical protein